MGDGASFQSEKVSLFARLFRGTRPAVVATEVRVGETARKLVEPQAGAAAGEDTGAKREAIIGVVRFSKDLPTYSAILSAPKGKLASVLTANERLDVVLVSMATDTVGDQFCQVICTPSFAQQAHGYADLQRRLNAIGWKTRPPVRAVRELIAALYEEGAEERATEVETSDMERLFDMIAHKAVEMVATDIHFEIRGSTCRVVLRVRKRLHALQDLSGQQAVKLLSTMFQSLSEQDARSSNSFSLKEQQFCAINRFLHGTQYRFRYQHAPVSPSGADCVLRVLRIGEQIETKKFEGFEALGYSAAQSDLIEEMFADPKGVILISGKMGSGKSTTLKYGLEFLGQLRPGAKIRTIEDPPEYYIASASQHPVARRKKENDQEGTGEEDFARTFISILRMDADATMLGEIRDPVTSRLTVQAGQAGQKVAATIHASSAFGIVHRLEELGVSKETMSAEKFLSGLIFQELLPVVCPHCSKTAAEMAQIIQDGGKMQRHAEMRRASLKRVLTHLRPYAKDIRFEGLGCDHCDDRGTVDLTVCAEVVIPDERFRQCIATGDLLGAIRHWEGRLSEESGADGLRCIDHAMGKLLRGQISVEAYEEAFGFMTPRLLGRTLDHLSTHPKIFGAHTATAIEQKRC